MKKQRRKSTFFLLVILLFISLNNSVQSFNFAQESDEHRQAFILEQKDPLKMVKEEFHDLAELREQLLGLNAPEMAQESFNRAEDLARSAIRARESGDEEHARHMHEEARHAYRTVLMDVLNYGILQRAMDVLMEQEGEMRHESMRRLEETRDMLRSQMEAEHIPVEELLVNMGDGIVQAYDQSAIDIGRIGFPADLLKKLIPGLKAKTVKKDFTFEGGLKTQKGSPTGNQTVLVIFVRASDNTTANLGNLRTSEIAEFTNLQTFYTESSFNQITFTHTWAPQAGWYQLSNTYDDYVWTNADVNAAPAGSAARKKAQGNLNTMQGFTAFATECMQEAQDDSYTIKDYDQIVIVIIGGFLRGESAWPYTYTLKDSKGKSFQVKTTVLVVSTNTGWSRTAHEYGHAFGHWPDSYYSSTRRPGRWDLMDCTDCGAQTPGFNKDYKAGWYKGTHASRFKKISRPTGLQKKTDKSTLVPYSLQNPAAGSLQTLRLDVGGGVHLYVENRQSVAGNVSDQNLLGNGIIITDALEDVKKVNVHRDPIQLYGGPISSGSTFKDQAYGDLKLEVSGTVPNLDVKTTWGPDPYIDLYITPWDAPPWESVDIWVDSPVNGWGTYEYKDAAKNPGVTGNPVRNGDRPLVGKVNRLYARIRNIGTKDVNNVKVAFFVTDPQGIGQKNTTWSLIDRKTIATIQGERSAVSPAVNFIPNASAHTCIKVKIDYQTGELNANNNETFENISDFNTTSSSPWKPVDTELLVENPYNSYKEIIMEMDGLPKDWKGWVSERVIDLPPKGSKKIQYRIMPGLGGSMDLGSAADIHVVGYVDDDKNHMPLGGVTSVVHLVEKSSISIDVPESFSASQLNGLRVILTYTPKYNNIPVALAVSDVNTDNSSIYSTMTNSTGITELNIGQLISSGDIINLQPGCKYAFQAFLYGNQSVNSAKSVETLVDITP